MQTFVKRWKGHARIDAGRRAARVVHLLEGDAARRPGLRRRERHADPDPSVRDEEGARGRHREVGQVARRLPRGDRVLRRGPASRANVPIVAAHGVCRGRGRPRDPEAPRRRRLPQPRVEHEARLRESRRSPRWRRKACSGASAPTVRRARTTTSRCSRPWTSPASSPRSRRSIPTVLPARGSRRRGHALRRAGARSRLDRIGSLEPGKRRGPDRHRRPHAPRRALRATSYSTLVYSAKASDVTDVWVDGRRLLDARRPTTLDEQAILDAAIRWRREGRRRRCATGAARRREDDLRDPPGQARREGAAPARRSRSSSAGVVSGEVPDYQAAAFLMAAVIQRPVDGRDRGADRGDARLGRVLGSLGSGAGRGQAFDRRRRRQGDARARAARRGARARASA